MELVSRFLVFRGIENIREEGIGNLGEYITKSIVKMIEDPDYDTTEEERIFRETFKNIRVSLGDSAFIKYYSETDTFKGAFSVSCYEAITYGLGYNFESYEEAGRWPDINQKVKSLWSEPEFYRNIGSGYNASYRIGHTLPIARTVFAI